MTDVRRRQPANALETWGLAIITGCAFVIVLAVWAAGTIGDAINSRPTTSNPFGYLADLILGRRSWPGLTSTLILIGSGTVLLAGLLTLIIVVRRRRKTPTLTRLAAAAALMAKPSELGPLSPAGVAESARRLRPSSAFDPHDPTQHGRLLGHTLIGNMPLRTDWERLGVAIWGPRTGKTTSQTIPNVVEAPGAVLATSNKRDLVDATRYSRSKRGTVWIFDPQQVATEPPTWWYNPLSRIQALRDAEVLAGHFASGTRDPNAQTDAYFDGSAEALLAAYLYAAALDSRPITDTYEWLANSRDKTAHNILKRENKQLVAADVRSIQEAPDKQRQGVYDTAKALLTCLRDERVLEWVTPPSDGRPEFNAAEFAASTDTLYCMSMEGAGSCAPLVNALTDHVTNAAVTLASSLAGGRLDPPMYCALDEAANVTRWRQLPDLYSHFGSRGVLIDVILQSWEQGVEVWGRSGMEKLWTAANVRTYGGGVADDTFLQRLSKLVGPYDREMWSTSIDPHGRRTRSDNPRSEEILPVDLLAAMPAGRALVLAAGCPATLVATQPWMAGPYADDIQTSLAKHDPGARQPSTV
jgi:type IV secretory pathway TraG/TraD family ATPase VirD4